MAGSRPPLGREIAGEYGEFQAKPAHCYKNRAKMLEKFHGLNGNSANLGKAATAFVFAARLKAGQVSTDAKIAAVRFTRPRFAVVLVPVKI